MTRQIIHWRGEDNLAATADANPTPDRPEAGWEVVDVYNNGIFYVSFLLRNVNTHELAIWKYHNRLWWSRFEENPAQKNPLSGKSGKIWAVQPVGR